MEADFQMDFMHPDQENNQVRSNKRMQTDKVSATRAICR
jgi:hypothetical protein